MQIQLNFDKKYNSVIGFAIYCKTHSKNVYTSDLNAINIKNLNNKIYLMIHGSKNKFIIVLQKYKFLF